MSNHAIALYAPLSGRTIELDRVPDPVFAGKMVGDGVAIDPTSEILLAPCSGVVKQIHPSCHALTLETPSGLEILMHIGLDTVALKSEGFTPKVKIGDSVEKGQELIAFDAALIAEKARSLITLMLITNTEAIASLQVSGGAKRAGQDQILSAVLAVKENDKEVTSGISQMSEPIVVPNPQGLHARPAAVLAALAKKFKSNLQLVRGEQFANCKSVVALMSLQVLHNEVVRFRACGEDAQEALKALSEALSSGLGETAGAPSVTSVSSSLNLSAQPMIVPGPLSPAQPNPRTPDTENLLHAVSASPGLAVGQIYQMLRAEYEVPEEGQGPQKELEKLHEAIKRSHFELEQLEAGLKAKADPNKAAIFAAHRELLNDPDLIEQAEAGINKGKSAAYSWKQAYTSQAERLAQLSHQLMAARAVDLRDIGERVLRFLAGKSQIVHNFPENTILIAEDLTPSDTAALDRSKVVGFCTVLGGSTSHAAILARSLDLPALAGISAHALSIANGTKAVLNATKGTLELNPSQAEYETAKEKLKFQQQHRRVLLSKAQEPAVTSDGRRVEVAANVGSVADTEQAVRMGADGVGLLRSEFLFLARTTPPTEDEQAEIYSQAAKILGGSSSLIIRTLDVGGDKPLPYLPIQQEANPFLGERGLRVSLLRPDLLRTQFRAILRAAGFAKVQIILPMVTTIGEYRQARAIFDEECRNLEVKVPLGIMIEVPAAALMADTLAKEVDFFSIGTNDLTQYTTAIDRGHPQLARLTDSLHPSVLRLIKITADGAHKYNRKVGICGGIAGDLQAAAILVGLGADELSVAAPVIPAIKDRIRQVSMEECRQLAAQALACESSEDVRKLQEDIER
ncbi:MAG: phosphoenolpyruvate--protein phosphotransferase [Candidatus Bruticola sp.]